MSELFDQCNERIIREWADFRCQHSVWRDGKCKTHHPDTLAEKRKLVDELYAARAARLHLQELIGKAEVAVLAAADAWFDIDSDDGTGITEIEDALHEAIQRLRAVRETK